MATICKHSTFYTGTFSFIHSTFGVSSISGAKTKESFSPTKYIVKHGNILVLQSIIPVLLCACECCKYTK